MSYHWDQLYKIAQERQREDIAAARQYHLAKEAARTSPDPIIAETRPAPAQVMRKVYQPKPQRLLFYLGVRLSNWGCILQSRYGQLR